MEQATATVEIEQMRGEQLAAFFEAFIAGHTKTTIKDDPTPRPKGTGIWDVEDFPLDKIANFTGKSPDCVVFYVDDIDPDEHPGKRNYEIEFRAGKQSLFRLALLMIDTKYMALNSRSVPIDLDVDEGHIAGILAGLITLEHEDKLKPRFDYVPAAMPAIPESRTPGSSTSAADVAGAFAVEDVVATESTADTRTEKPSAEERTRKYNLGKKFKSIVQSRSGYIEDSESATVFTGSWNVEYPLDFLPVDTERIIDSVTFETAEVVETGGQKNSISFFCGDERIVTITRADDSEYYIAELDEIGVGDLFTNFQAIDDMLTTFEKLKANGFMTPA
ncbi:MAG TPA: hypothetical protein VLG47_07665 [Candidatus Saccharimonadales bacterium]|nr:hypothetical protein [Candidatus Saccharimonadales bacterium]